MRGRETDQRRKHEPEPCPHIVILDQDEDLDSPKRVSFKVKETVCSRTSQQSPEQCDFRENGVSLGLEEQENASQGAEQWLWGQNCSSWDEVGCGWEVMTQGFQSDLEPPLPAAERVCGDSHPVPEQG